MKIVPKTQAPGQIDIQGVDTFTTNAVPDPFDERDLIYRPQLTRLKDCIDQRDIDNKQFLVLHQMGNSVQATQ